MHHLHKHDGLGQELLLRELTSGERNAPSLPAPLGVHELGQCADQCAGTHVIRVQGQLVACGFGHNCQGFGVQA